MQLAHPGLVIQESFKKVSKMISSMLKIFRNAAFTEEKAPAGCSELAKGF